MDIPATASKAMSALGVRARQRRLRQTMHTSILARGCPCLGISSRMMSYGRSTFKWVEGLPGSWDIGVARRGTAIKNLRVPWMVRGGMTLLKPGWR